MKKFPLLTLVFSSIVVLIAGCGGGGSSSNNNSVNVPTAAVQITSSNATTVASNANTASQSTASQGGTRAASIVAAVTQTSGRLPSVLTVVSSEFDRVIAMKLPAPAVVGATVGPYAYNCTSGASVASGSSNSFTITYSYANGSYLSQGDSLTVSYASCGIAGTSVAMNGNLSFSIGTLTGPAGGPYSAAGFTVTYGNFSFGNGSETIAMNGDMTIAASKTSTVRTSTISGTSFSMSDTIGGNTNSFMIYGASGYNLTYTSDSSNLAYTFSANMQVASTGMGGSITIATPTTFQGTGSGYPSTGIMTITGSNGSSLTLTTLSSASVELRGTNGTTQFGPTTVAWSAL